MLSSAPLGVLALLSLGLVVAGTGRGQTAEESAAKIIRFLIEPVGPTAQATLPRWDATRLARNRAATSSLVALGPAAIPDLEAALDLFGRQEPPPFVSDGSGWLLMAYAKIRGRAALSRLRSMADSPQLAHRSVDLDWSLAVALDLTSYISASRPALDLRFGLWREPRAALDRLILAWLIGDQQQVEDALGPHARLALDSLLARESWSDLRKALWRGATSSGCALGYRFDVPGDWSKPDATLDEGLEDRRRRGELEGVMLDPNLPTHFVGKFGVGCGSRKVSFALLQANSVQLLPWYVVDDADVEGLLSMITGCAVAEPASDGRDKRGRE
jgi:hypothetical protein